MSNHQRQMRTYARLRCRYTVRDYEAAKQRWVAENPSATSQQYEQAMRKIAARMGL